MWLPHVVIVSQVESYDAKSKGLRVVTQTGYRVVIWPWTDDKLGNLTYYPVRPGYASTVMKFQGAELSHVTYYADCPGVHAAAYTALSRVRRGLDFLIGGLIKKSSFVPAK